MCGLLALSITLAACGGDDERGFGSGESGINTAGAADETGVATGDGGEDEVETMGADGTGGDGAEDEDTGYMPKFDIGPGNTGTGEEEECAEFDEQAELIPVPADIIIVVDNSGSMGFEASEVQARLNDFSNQIIASGVDVRVVLISSYPDDGNGICIDAPLGSGGCPNSDNAPPTFTHVDEEVGSHDAWERLVDTHGQWSSVIRPGSIKHLVVVTDDTSHTDLDEFTDDFAALSPDYVDYVHHSVVCHSDCESAAGIGENYINLSNNTGGVAADLCDQDFQAVFDVLTTEVIGGSQLSCEFQLPEPPEGLEFDPDEVNVEFDDGMGGVLLIGRVESAAECEAVADGWYYDDPVAPTSIIMCPQTCESFQGSISGSVNFELGCATVPAG
ncbi:MAG: hypothetical protein AAF799_27655 [Myxococcota bacterium]